jgi:L-aspartate oxidase
LRFGLDLGQQPAPVHPAAHYAMGGVKTDLDGRTTVDRLFAAGEAACNGVHGANRLASNSLLEGLVFGARAGRLMRGLGSAPAHRAVPRRVLFPRAPESELRRMAWEHCGVLRSGEGLAQVFRALSNEALVPKGLKFRQDFEARSIYLVLRLIAQAALAREECRGGHYRLDFPEKREAFHKHTILHRNRPVEFPAKLRG